MRQMCVRRTMEVNDVLRRKNDIYRASQKKVGFRICNSPVVWDDQRSTKLTDTTQQLPPPPATKNLEFPKRNRTSNFGFWPAPKFPKICGRPENEGNGRAAGAPQEKMKKWRAPQARTEKGARRALFHRKYTNIFNKM